ncbi:glycosyltransferase [Dyadobacter diqingensis]|uniref:glycosyltransferase n=1 Tax=Dyadobacter diqingensis TaxID=2938121 RepID=UPI0020C41685|nr:glycosyltransferase [Dyadobacter diqingensis]
MKLQGLTVCVNYADFFEQTGRANLGVFDKFVVVTDLADTEVSALCEEFGYFLVKTDVFYENGASFNKYAGINEGLKHIDDDAWVLFVDSDIVLQPDTKRVLTELNLDESFLYGFDRVNCVGFENWTKYKNGRGVLEHNWMLTSAGLPLGARLVHYYGHEGENGKFEGWRPLGFAQLCHRSAFKLYPQESNGADHCDLLFARLWDRKHRAHIPELLGVHLESHQADNGVNWYGRKSDPFIPARPAPPAVPPGRTIREWEVPRTASQVINYCDKEKDCDPPRRPERPIFDAPRDFGGIDRDKIIGFILLVGIVIYIISRFFRC